MFEEEDYSRARKILDRGLAVLAKKENVPGKVRDPGYAETLMELMRLVLKENEVISLTAIEEPDEFAALHLLDSLACAELPEFAASGKVVDVGSGPGFPGLPLAALYPEKRFLLTDSLRKRIGFAAFAAERLGLDNVETLHTRAENAGRDPALRERFDIALCRAVGKLPIVMEYCLPLVRTGGTACFYKTVTAESEIESSRLARELLGGGEEVRVLEYSDLLPGRQHALFTVKKDKTTPKTYPRREGIPSKVPL